MSLTAGIVGLPNVGKSTLFNAITNAGAEMANYPFATIKPNVGMVEVPDKRLDRINEIIPSKKIVPTTFEFTDIAGIVKGASKGEGLGNKFLENIRQTDAIIHVVRAFDDGNITSVTGKVDPVEDIETINLELSIADLDSVNKRIGKVQRAAKGNDKAGKAAKAELTVLEKVKPVLEKGGAAREVDLDDDQKKILKGEFLLTSKPTLYVANIAESSMADPSQDKYFQAVKKYADDHGAQAIGIAAETEEEIAEMPDEDKKEFLAAEGVKEPGLNKLIRASYKLLGLETYFTAGGPETKAWTYKKGTKAPQAAGIIHSDFERGFIRAEIIAFDDLDKLGSEQAVKDAGKLHVEGKDYVMHDGDIVNFRFNV
ncbi:ribosome-binding ATPase YchF [Philodulcilactobacillus myokoensis]|uniref:Ribosome-binding ATPase YchF n=1 Tax=Philodulcilactobacillus myokoensis TaxID=2929573 RepID=A0A9W6B1J5_9LACO|nr:redox-regulated ATPase YchF [Philodulcilactobacillus myokoensis]GLB47254.1 ribosome-binding ATPase YchF [Philodulcilactobacillus myokoensis]